jgi:hypothetical protein
MTYFQRMTMKVLLKQQELGRELTMEEQNVLKSEAMEEAFVEASQTVAAREQKRQEP